MKVIMNIQSILSVTVLVLIALLITGCSNIFTESLAGASTENDDAITEKGLPQNGNYVAEYHNDYYPGTEKYGELQYSPFFITAEDSQSTFSIDVDKGSYTLARKKINQGDIPTPASIRVEEFINYFEQDYLPPDSDPLNLHIDGASSPFRDSITLLRIGIKGKEIDASGRKPWNITFLVDVSGSMTGRIAMVKYALNVLVDNMQTGDQISLCTYAGGVATIITPTTLDNREAIKTAINDLGTGGSTAMASGIENAYRINMSGFMEEGVNRIVVCSDGDANVGVTGHEEILELISSWVDKGIMLSTIGFGQGNYNDHLMEQLADNGNGNYFYVDSEKEAQRLFTRELTGAIQVVAKDVKIQVTFNPETVYQYRLIGYENRDIADSDFVKEETDAGELGSGHCVTALYELVLADNDVSRLGSISLLYKIPETEETVPLQLPICRSSVEKAFGEASDRFRFTTGVAEFAELMRGNPYATGSTMAAVEAIIAASHDSGNEQDREVLSLIGQVRQLGFI